MTDSLQKIQELFEDAGRAHHEAYAASDGADPEWPLWYADYLQDKLPPLLDAQMTQSELVYLLLLLKKQQAREAPGMAWTLYYARELVSRYGLGGRGQFPEVSGVPYVTTEQMREVDRLMIEEYRIELMQMMENAGRNLAWLARARFLKGDPRGKRVVVLAGTGGNGGGALVCARHLHNQGAAVQVIITKGEKAFSPVPRHQLEILRRMSLPVSVGAVPSVAFGEDGKESPDLIVDGLIGYSLSGAPGGSAGELIRWANGSGLPLLALDAPSGVDTSTGTVYEPAIRATATMTLALPKEGLRAPGVVEQVGELYLADISVPPALYAAPGLELEVANIFGESAIVRL